MSRQYISADVPRIAPIKAQKQTVVLTLVPIPDDADLVSIEQASAQLTSKLGRGWSKALIYERLKGEWENLEGYLWINTALEGRKNKIVRIWVDGVLKWVRKA